MQRGIEDARLAAWHGCLKVGARSGDLSNVPRDQDKTGSRTSSHESTFNPYNDIIFLD